MTTMTETTTNQGYDWRAAREAREAELLASYSPLVPGMPGDGTPVVLHTETHAASGGTLTYTWHNLSTRTQDFSSLERGYVVSRLVVTYTAPEGVEHAGAEFEVGHLNVTHTTPEVLADQFATPFHWADENTSASFGFRWRKNPEEITDAMIWAAAWNDLRDVLGAPESTKDKTRWICTYGESDAPTDPKVLAAELKIAEKHYAKMMRGFLRFVSVPMVDYSHIDNGTEPHARFNPAHPGNLRGTGIGTRMYVLAARHLATMGKVLRGSGLQSDEAEALWARLAADPTLPIRKTRLTFYKRTRERTKTYLCLDYTRVEN